MNWKVIGDEQTTFTIIQDDEDSVTVIGWSDEEKYARIMSASNELLDALREITEEYDGLLRSEYGNDYALSDHALLRANIAIENAAGE
jgi:hypothetical protein